VGAREFTFEFDDSLAAIRVFLDEASKLVFNEIEESVDLILVITPLADRRLAESDVVNVGGR
jgi:hypothetical protein